MYLHHDRTFHFVARNIENTYQTAVNDVINIEFPSSAKDGFTLLVIIGGGRLVVAGQE